MTVPLTTDVHGEKIVFKENYGSVVDATAKYLLHRPRCTGRCRRFSDGLWRSARPSRFCCASASADSGLPFRD